MKKLLLISSLLVLSLPSYGQDIVTEAYFHELKGMEDSAGVTHLFYRQYVDSENFCEQGGNERYLDSQTNGIYHFNASVQSDSVLFWDGYSEWCIESGMSEGLHVNSYLFLNNNLDMWIKGETSVTTDPAGGLAAYNSQDKVTYLGTGFFGPQKISQNASSDSIFIVIEENFEKTLRLSSDSQEWPADIYIGEETHDSLFVEKNVIRVSPFSDSTYYSVAESNLYKSTNYGKTYTLADSTRHWDIHSELYFSADSSHVYSVRGIKILISNNQGAAGSWDFLDIDFATDSEKFLTIDQQKTGQLFVSDSTTILHSTDYGDYFSSLTTTDHQITGLYKKPASDLLYVLTREELLEVNTQTKAVTSLKTIPVSNEPEPSNLPTQITLKQNYPNPFNPTTVISYQLNSNQLVRLEVFDVTGRKVATLVDGERQSAGKQQVTFEASGLSSGVYFYRLETGGKTLTRKMLLVK